MKLTGNRCRCAACGEYFNSVAAFDMHRAGRPDGRRCEEPSGIGMAKNNAGFWVTSRMELKPAQFGGTKREKSTIS